MIRSPEVPIKTEGTQYGIGLSLVLKNIEGAETYGQYLEGVKMLSGLLAVNIKFGGINEQGLFHFLKDFGEVANRTKAGKDPKFIHQGNR